MPLPLDNNTMPMAQSARLPLDDSLLMGAMPQRAPATSAPPPQAAGLIGGNNPQAMFPAVNAPAQPPYTVRMQPDGSSVYEVPDPSGQGQPVVIGVNAPPKLPKALQSPSQTQA